MLQLDSPATTGAPSLGSELALTKQMISHSSARATSSAPHVWGDHSRALVHLLIGIFLLLRG
eukprot:9479356-Pyramimonas_sp.AAC.1